jgi:hypothetical protein
MEEKPEGFRTRAPQGEKGSDRKVIQNQHIYRAGINA